MHHSKTLGYVLGLAVATVLLAGPVWAGREHLRGYHIPSYAKATEKTVEGKVTEVIRHVTHEGWSDLHLFIQAGPMSYDIDVGPIAYVRKQGFKFSKGDDIKITGSEFLVDQDHVLLARQLEHDGKSLTLRNAAGDPIWPSRYRI